MVYNDTPTTILERIRSKFAKRTADAILSAYSNESGQERDAYADSVSDKRVKVSFFGEAVSEDSQMRSIPSRRKADSSSVTAENKPVASRRGKAHAKVSNRSEKKNAPVMSAPKNNTAKKTENRDTIIKEKKVNGQMNHQMKMKKNPVKSGGNVKSANAPARGRTGSREVPGDGLFFVARKRGAEMQANISNVKVPNNRRYVKSEVHDEVLVRGRSNINGSRHAVIKTNAVEETWKEKLGRFFDTFKDNHKAEHRVKKAPFPLAYATLVVVCSVMAMILIFSHSEVNEYESMINNLQVKQTELDDTAKKLELQLELRDDIRTIESIAVDYIGMVNSDVATTKYVTVAAEDRVEILRAEEEETGGFAALLSALGEGIGKFSEYFN